MTDTLYPDHERADREHLELLQRLIRSACTNDGTLESGQEHRNVAVLRDYLADALASTRHTVSEHVFEPAIGRQSLVIRIQGADPEAESLALVGHTDVVGVEDESQWTHPPFDAVIADGSLWGRGTMDMLTLTAAFAVATKRALESDTAPAGDVVFIAAADEEGGSRLGMQWLITHHPQLVLADNVVSESGGSPIGNLAEPGDPRRPAGVIVTVGEKGIAPQRLRVQGTPGHGSSPWGTQNAGLIAARVALNIAEAQSHPRITQRWRGFVEALGAPEREALLDPVRIRGALGSLGALAGFGHASTHTTYSPNAIHAGGPFNVIPGQAEVLVDVRTLPGDTEQGVQRHILDAIGADAQHVEITTERYDEPSLSPTDTRLFSILGRIIGETYPGAKPVQIIGTGGSDLRFYRQHGKTAYGIGLLSERWNLSEYRKQFHGIDEHIDLASVSLMRSLVDRLVRRFAEPEPRWG